MTVLAEVSDKIPTNLSTLLVSTLIVAILVGLAGFRWWVALLALPVFALWSWVQYSDLRESGFGPRIWEEMGAGYVVGQFVAINAPAVIGAWVVARFRAADSGASSIKGLVPAVRVPARNRAVP